MQMIFPKHILRPYKDYDNEGKCHILCMCAVRACIIVLWSFLRVFAARTQIQRCVPEQRAQFIYHSPTTMRETNFYDYVTLTKLCILMLLFRFGLICHQLVGVGGIQPQQCVLFFPYMYTYIYNLKGAVCIAKRRVASNSTTLPRYAAVNGARGQNACTNNECVKNLPNQKGFPFNFNFLS